LRVGGGVRTIAVSPDDKSVYAAARSPAAVVQIDAESWRKVAGTPASPSPVGLAVSPDGRYVVLTSQGDDSNTGGNSLEVFRTFAE
jgi:DNA-binding beta-propeller fold protein YncE